MIRPTPPAGSFLQLVASLGLTLGAAAWGLVYPRADVVRLAGCYRVPLDAGGEEPPVLIRLDTAAEPYARRWLNAKAMRVHRIPVPAPDLATLYWTRSWGESIDLVSSDGFGGVALRLEPDGADLAGSAGGFSDVVSRDPPPAAPVRARRVPCP